MKGCWESLLKERQTHDWKVTSSNPGRSGEGIFFSTVNFLCWLLFGVSSTPSYCSHCAKSADGRLHLNLHTPLTQRCRSGLTMLSMHGVGTVPIRENELTNRSPFFSGRNPRSDTVVRQRDKTYSCYGNRQTTTPPSDSVLCLMRIAHARFLSDTTHCPMMTSVFLSCDSVWSRPLRKPSQKSSLRISM